MQGREEREQHRERTTEISVSHSKAWFPHVEKRYSNFISNSLL
jgi:hypothetical protein